MPVSVNRRLSRSSSRRAVVVAVVLLFAVIGSFLLLSSKAASLQGDINNDGTVNAFDLSLLLSSYGQSAAACTTASQYTCDLNGDSAVNVFDLSILLSNYGQTATVASGCTSGSVVAPCMNGSASGTGASGWGTPIFDDEFDGSSLDTTKWATGWFGSGLTPAVNSSEQTCYDPSDVSESGGSLNLTTIQSSCTVSGKTYNYRSGLVSTNPQSGASNVAKPGFQATYGYFEARMYLPGSAGKIYNWPAFWTDGQSWPTDGEMDVMEGLDGPACWHFHDPSGGPGGCASGDYTGWHTFAGNWQPGVVTYYYDGKQVGQISSGITSSPMYLILQVAVNSSDSSPAAPSTVKVDYVRVWQ